MAVHDQIYVMMYVIPALVLIVDHALYTGTDISPFRN